MAGCFEKVVDFNCGKCYYKSDINVLLNCDRKMISLHTSSAMTLSGPLLDVICKIDSLVNLQKIASSPFRKFLGYSIIILKRSSLGSSSEKITVSLLAYQHPRLVVSIWTGKYKIQLMQPDENQSI